MSTNSTDSGATDHEVEGVEYVPVCDRCFKPVYRSDDDKAWVHA